MNSKQKLYRINSQRQRDKKMLNSSGLRSPQAALAAAQTIPFSNRKNKLEDTAQTPKNLPSATSGLQAMYERLIQELELEHVLPELQLHGICRHRQRGHSYAL